MKEELIKKEAEEQTKNPQSQLEECKKTCQEYLNNWKRAAADLINYKKDEMERAVEMIKYAKEDMVLKILPALDSLYLAHKQIPQKVEESAWMGGFLQIEKQMEEFLKKEGIEEINAIGEKFNPETMEAIGEISNDQFPIPNTVAEELQKGYCMDGKVIRPAKVKIGK